MSETEAETKYSRAYDPLADPDTDPATLSDADPTKELLGNDLGLLKWLFSHQDERYHVWCYDKNDGAPCPVCGHISHSLLGHGRRNPQTIPIDNHPVVLHIRTNRYRCTNPECPMYMHSFSAPLDIVKPYQQSTGSLRKSILSISIFNSDIAAEHLCKRLGIIVSHDKINDIIRAVKTDDEPGIDAIGIDDVATHKGQSYDTTVYDAHDHHNIALLKGRDGKELKKFLERHPNIHLIARDRGGTYALVSTMKCPYAKQVADPFHLCQNLTGYLRDDLKANIPEHIFIKDGSILEKEPAKVYTLKTVPQDALGSLHVYDNSPAVDSDGNEVKINAKLPKTGKAAAASAAARQKKYEMVKAVREEYNHPEKAADTGTAAKAARVTKASLVRKYGISRSAVTKYLGMSDEDVEGLKDISPRKSHSMVDGYENMIYKMLGDHIPAIEVSAYVQKHGYTGSVTALNSKITAIALNNYGRKLSRFSFVTAHYPEGVEVISRGSILKYILIKDKDKMKDSPVALNFDLIRKAYPIIDWVKAAWERFHSILMGHNPDLLDPFLDDYEDSAIAPFVNGIRRDEDAVRNAIIYDLNSGFVEGDNNKFKVIKRIMYGRASTYYLGKRFYAASYVVREGQLPELAA